MTRIAFLFRFVNGRTENCKSNQFAFDDISIHMFPIKLNTAKYLIALFEKRSTISYARELY